MPGRDPNLWLALLSLGCGVITWTTCFTKSPLILVPAVVGVVAGLIAQNRYSRCSAGGPGPKIATIGWMASGIGLAVIATLGLILLLVVRSGGAAWFP